MHRAAQAAPDTALQYPAQQAAHGRFFAVIHPRLAVLLPLARVGFQQRRAGSILHGLRSHFFQRLAHRCAHAALHYLAYRAVAAEAHHGQQ